MTVKLLTEHHLESLSLKGGCTGSSESTRQNTTLLEIACHGSIITFGNTERHGPYFVVSHWKHLIEILAISTKMFSIEK